MTDEFKKFIIENLTPYQLLTLEMKFEIQGLIKSAFGHGSKAKIFRIIAVKYQITPKQVKKIWYCKLNKKSNGI